MIGLSLDNCQPSRPIGLGLQQHNGAFSGSHNVAGLLADERPNQDLCQGARQMQGLSTVEKPNRDFCHQLQDTVQTGLITVNGETGWKDSRVDSTMGEMAAYIHGNQGVLAGRLAGHETLL